MNDTDTRDVLTLRDYVAILVRRKAVVIGIALILPAAAVLMALQEQSRYEASTKVLIGIGAVPQGSNQRVAPDRVLQTAAQVARASDVATRTLDAAGVRGRTAQNFLANSSVRANRDSDLIVFQVEDPDPRLAVQLVSEYAKQFIAYRRALDDGRYAREAGDALLVGPASSPVKVAPRIMRTAVLAFGIAGILAVILAFLVDALSARVTSTEQLAAGLRVPLLGRLPKPSRRLRRQNALAMLAEPTGAAAEAFRLFRTNLEFFNLERGARTLMVTSAVDSEGKSTTIANLALALARMGRRVILVDLDIRRATQHRFFDLERQPGVTDVALGGVPVDEALVDVELAQTGTDPTWPEGPPKGSRGSLRVLPAGSIPHNRGEFVASDELEALLAELSKRADLVLIDSPPLLGGGDAVTLSAHMDALLLVARLDVLRRPVVDEARRTLEFCRAAPIGFVATGVEPTDTYKQPNRRPQGGGLRRRNRDRDHIIPAER
jgi:receptor protein-tyrosine kinase